ncbi:STY4851/ECs_5259 family protein [Vibrio breoganii]|uniref:STY4851/ECs_5259 family protein n=1 Tax=Vibrio breoganii TaxID=553239 RepID=UPI000C8656A6|nr:STY4851/ECs_5259 family protein [Vibrio breoganii]PMJ44299.1 hypothetical protein BCU21_16130 [Vibrio breoganii]PMK59422.1 hypothetical protein BCT97_06440 [Vibrio breoganii]PMM86767.1 hypothetical protein BCT45_05650 [Vibrio breoganii]PMO29221.1 hypothetical protein BCT14_06615 [Vibrio breoganii]PMO32943.1 hypothetical protein BCT13_08580 [Vibrio breoganii]
MQTFRQSIFDIWKNRGVLGATGSPLYSYKLADYEFDGLKVALMNSLKSQSLESYLPSSMSSDWAGAFVLYASEWWRKEFSGGIWSWDPIFDSLGLTGNEITASQRNRLIAGGFRFWRRPVLTNTQGNMYLGTVAVEGGLPLKLVSDPNNKLAHYFEQVIQDFGKFSLSKPNSIEIARVHDHNIAASFRNDTVYAIVGKIAESVFNLADQYGLDEQKDPVRYLDAVAPNWLDTLPINIEHSIAKGLLERALGKAITIQRRMPNTIRLIRSLHKNFDRHTYNLDDSAEATYTWALQSQLTLRTRVNAMYIQQLFSIPTLPEKFSLFAVGKKPLLVAKAFLPQNHKDRFLLDVITSTLPSDWFPEEVQLMLKDECGNTWFAPLVGGSALDENEPWVFIDRENSLQLHSTGDVKCEESSAFVVTSTLPSLMNNIEVVGNLEKPGKSIITLKQKGCYTFGAYAVELGSSQSEHIEYVWNGDALPYQTNPAKCFVGEPNLIRLDDQGRRENISPAQVRWHEKSKQQWLSLATMPYGQNETAYVENGKPKKRFRLSKLPTDFDVEIVPGANIHRGKIVISASSLPMVAVDQQYQDSVISQVTQDNDSLTLDLVSTEQPPAFITVDLWWLDRAKSISVELPYPSRGVCLLEGHDKSVDKYSELLIDNLNNYELYGYGLTGEIELQFTLHARNIRGAFAKSAYFNSTLPSIDALANGLALASYRDNIQALFALSDSLDATVKLSVVNHGQEVYNCSFAAYSESLLPNREAKLVELSSAKLADQTVELYTVPLGQPDQTPLALVEEDVQEDSQKRAWTIPDNELEPGAWLIYNKDMSQGIRPVMWSKDLELLPETKNGFEVASGHGSRWDRLSAFSDVASAIAYDFTRPEWKYVRTLLTFDNVPLTTFDLWRGAIRQNEFVFAMLLNANKSEIDRVWQIDKQFPFMWYALNIESAIKVCNAFYNNLIERLGDDMADVAITRLSKKLRELVSYYPAFGPLADFLLSKFDSEQTRPSIGAAAFGQRVFDARNELSQRQIDKRWPSFSADSIISQVMRKMNPEWVKLCLTDKHSFKNSVMNAPVVLALSTCGQADLNMTPEVVHALREYRRFDEVYFDEAFSLTHQFVIGMLKG